MKRLIVGISSAVVLLGGGAVATDEAINPYTDTGSALEVEKQSNTKDAGKNEVELIKERPEVRLKRWDGEVNLGVRYEGVVAEGERPLFTDRMEWKDGAQEVHAYPLEATAQMEDGGFEIEVVLNEAPTSNVFDFVIEGAEDLDFFYQRPLTDKDVGKTQPENVAGSYAVYHKDKVNHIEGRRNYATGKLFHIFRPKAIDANGQETWAELSYANGTLSVTVPQTFLDTATYPVRVDPTFGNTTIGVSTQTVFFAVGQLYGVFTATGGETVTSITAYGTVGAAETLKLAIYDVSAGVLVNRLGAVNNVAGDGTTRVYTAGGLSDTLSAGISYTVAAGAPATDFPTVAMDVIPNYEMEVDDDTTLAATWTSNGQDIVRLTLYATYTSVPTIAKVSTLPASPVTADTARLYGVSTDPSETALTETGFAYGTDATLATVIATSTLGTTNYFTQLLTSLTPSTTYYYRAYASSSAGIGYGSILNFTTAPTPNPAVMLRSGGKVEIGSGGSLIIQ